MKRLPKHHQRGAALLLAMMIVALVATLTSGMVWQQFRAIQVESAERSRSQAASILTGALGWSRLILREDGKSSSTDDLTEPWARELKEARLSTFLAADQDNNADSGPEAFLSGAISDAQARYNLRNLLADDGKLIPAETAVLGRLCESAGLSSDAASRIAQGLAASWKPPATAQADDATQPLPIQRFDQLTWIGIDPKWIEALRPVADVLPARSPVNLNTASREVIAAVLNIDLGTAERLNRQRPFKSVDKARPSLPPDTPLDPNRVSVTTSFFIVSGQMRLEDRVVEEQSLVLRRGNLSATEVMTIHRAQRSQHLGVP